MESSELDNERAPEGPGKRLRQARMEAGFSEREMADRLKWRPDYVPAIEENRFSELRGAAFVVGYLRAYARELGLPADELVDQYRAAASEDSAIVEPARRVETRLPQVQKQGLGVPVGVAAALLLVAGLWWFGGREDSTEAPPTASEQVSEEPSAVERPGVLTANGSVDAEPELELSAMPAVAPEREDEVTGTAPAEDTAAASVVTASPLDAQSVEESVEAVIEPEAPAAPDPVVEPESAAPAPAGLRTAGEGPDQLRFAFAGDCWIEVRDNSGRLVYADLRRGGDSLQVNGGAPFEVLLGDASVVELVYRSEQFDIPVRPGRTTARFSVGEQ